MGERRPGGCGGGGGSEVEVEVAGWRAEEAAEAEAAAASSGPSVCLPLVFHRRDFFVASVSVGGRGLARSRATRRSFHASGRRGDVVASGRPSTAALPLSF